MAYLLDSDVFIQAGRAHYSFEFCSAFWDWIDREHAAGKVISIDRVLKEIEEGKYGELKPWAASRPKLFLKSADEPTMKCLVKLALWARNNYDAAGYEQFFTKADFVLVGHALAHGHIMVTQENKKHGVSKIKIPHACEAMGVKCISTWDLLKTERPKFVLG